MKKFTKLLGIVLIIALVMSMGTAAFAVDDGSITISDAVDGEKYNLWKVFDLTYGGDGQTNAEGPDSETIVARTYTPVSYTYTSGGNSDTFLTALQGADSPFTLTAVTGSTTVFNVVRKTGATDQQIIDFVKNNISKLPADRQVLPADQVAANNTVSWTGLPYGYYYATSSLGSLVTIDSTLKAVSVHDKNVTTQQDKSVEENSTGNYGDKNDVKVGDKVKFQTKITIGAHQSNVVYHDIMQLDKLAMDWSSVKVYKADTSGNITTTELEAANITGIYYSYEGTNPAQTSTIPSDTKYSGDTFAIAFSNDYTEALSANTVLYVTYEATLTTGALVGDQSGKTKDQGNDNKSSVTYGDAQRTEWDWTRTYTWAIDIYKFTGTTAPGTPLADAVFNLKDSSGAVMNFVKVSDGAAAVKADPTANPPVAAKDGTPTIYRVAVTGDTTTTTDLVTPASGMIQIIGLDANKTGESYTLVEKDAPKGYNKLTSDITVTITSNTSPAADQGSDGTKQANGTVTVTNKQGTATGTGTINVLNQSGTELPSTGGIGTTIFYVVGSILVVAAGVLLITKKRMSREG